jgi:hypothetical protein
MPNPLSVIINPPGIQCGMPGDIVSLYVVVINEGDQSAVVDLFFSFDEAFQKISGWSNSPKASLAVAPKESSDEVTFDFEIPIDALPGTYDYTFVVDSPEHYPQDTPINFPGQLKVLLKEQTVIRASDPTFSIIPATNPNKPIIYRQDATLQAVIKVENRSNRVDRFRLTCPDFNDWFKITYPGTGLEAVGLFEVNAIELNPNTQGEINVEIYPPIETLAGSYSPTVRLISDNNPDLILLDLMYLLIPDNYQVDMELNTILGKVSHKKGAYELVLKNQGNLVRELSLTAKSRDEEELCTYKFESPEIKLLPDKTKKVNLAVKPQHWWRQPWIGEPLQMNFQVDVIDNSYPLANASHQASLLWKARPWWQFLLILLFGLGLFAGASYLIWRALNPDPLTIEEFSVDNSQLTEGDEARLNLTISNYKRKKDLLVTVKPTENNDAILNNEKIEQLIKPGTNNPNPPCRVTTQDDLICKGVPTGVRTKGKYIFELKLSSTPNLPLFNRRTQPNIQKTADVEIKEKPIAEVVDFKAEQLKYQRGKEIILSLTIRRPELIDKAQININKVPENVNAHKTILEFKNGNIVKPEELKDICTRQDNQTISCRIRYTPTAIGLYNYEVAISSINVKDRNSIKKSANNIEVFPKPFNLVFFRINNRDQPLNLEFNEGEEVTLSWKVEGEDIQVNLEPFQSNVRLVDTMVLKITNGFKEKVTLEVIDKSGKRQPQKKAFFITAKPKPTPAPSPTNPNVSIPSPNNTP